ncbi:hypothetical protein B0187_00820 [Haemophilus paracuniculus]|uniref:Uncharacterized protein n=1 Tax=Haemophilus paracuniculus TaxID=734 RepID=A0A1T0AV97_9PAST|nr:hypothetical protein [Haemophilus paracuniculus]OOS00867.1 hypothetical protein B0187_00820 [Haemophilus paracuniculus]
MNTPFSAYLNIARHLVRFILSFFTIFLMVIGFLFVLIPLLSGGSYQVLQSLSQLSEAEFAKFLDTSLQQVFLLTLMLLFIQKGMSFLVSFKAKLNSIEVQSK